MPPPLPHYIICLLTAGLRRRAAAIATLLASFAAVAAWFLRLRKRHAAHRYTAPPQPLYYALLFTTTTGPPHHHFCLPLTSCPITSSPAAPPHRLQPTPAAAAWHSRHGASTPLYSFFSACTGGIFSLPCADHVSSPTRLRSASSALHTATCSFETGASLGLHPHPIVRDMCLYLPTHAACAVFLARLRRYCTPTASHLAFSWWVYSLRIHGLRRRLAARTFVYRLRIYGVCARVTTAPVYAPYPPPPRSHPATAPTLPHLPHRAAFAVPPVPWLGYWFATDTTATAPRTTPQHLHFLAARLHTISGTLPRSVVYHLRCIVVTRCVRGRLPYALPPDRIPCDPHRTVHTLYATSCRTTTCPIFARHAYTLHLLPPSTPTHPHPTHATHCRLPHGLARRTLHCLLRARAWVLRVPSRSSPPHHDPTTPPPYRLTTGQRQRGWHASNTCARTAHAADIAGGTVRCTAPGTRACCARAGRWRHGAPPTTYRAGPPGRCAPSLATGRVFNHAVCDATGVATNAARAYRRRMAPRCYQHRALLSAAGGARFTRLHHTTYSRAPFLLRAPAAQNAGSICCLAQAPTRPAA